MPVREVQVDQGAEVAAHSDVLKLLFREPHGHGFYCNAIAGRFALSGCLALEKDKCELI